MKEVSNDVILHKKSTLKGSCDIAFNQKFITEGQVWFDVQHPWAQKVEDMPEIGAISVRIDQSQWEGKFRRDT